MILLLLSVDAHMAVPRFFVSSECLHNVNSNFTKFRPFTI